MTIFWGPSFHRQPRYHDNDRNCTLPGCLLHHPSSFSLSVLLFVPLNNPGSAPQTFPREMSVEKLRFSTFLRSRVSLPPGPSGRDGIRCGYSHLLSLCQVFKGIIFIFFHPDRRCFCAVMRSEFVFFFSRRKYFFKNDKEILRDEIFPLGVHFVRSFFLRPF